MVAGLTADGAGRGGVRPDAHRRRTAGGGVRAAPGQVRPEEQVRDVGLADLRELRALLDGRLAIHPTRWVGAREWLRGRVERARLPTRHPPAELATYGRAHLSGIAIR